MICLKVKIARSVFLQNISTKQNNAVTFLLMKKVSSFVEVYVCLLI
ncbi:hypothetical protein MIDIC_30007 [Alphaproteobacteria bacterium]